MKIIFIQKKDCDIRNQRAFLTIKHIFQNIGYPFKKQNLKEVNSQAHKNKISEEKKSAR